MPGVAGVVVVVDVEELVPVRPVRPLVRVWVELPDGVVCVVPDTEAPDGGVDGVDGVEGVEGVGAMPGVGDRLGVGDRPGAVEGVDCDGLGAIGAGTGCSGNVPGTAGKAGEPGLGLLVPLGGVAGETGCEGVAEVGGVMVV
ncbi:hypothetical protein [Terriglobus sp. RCC_193]|uniref:hypothetical protein n=1 Tax=Terriglobus sp. RCC_193 TaxID=3239218 RepID=UPI0035252315